MQEEQNSLLISCLQADFAKIIERIGGEPGIVAREATGDQSIGRISPLVQSGVSGAPKQTKTTERHSLFAH